MKLLRMFVYVVLRLPMDIFVVIPLLVSLFLLIPQGIYWWAEGTNDNIFEFYTPIEESAIPFYTTIKTVKQIWRSYLVNY